MTQALPYKDLRFDRTSSLRKILNTPDDGPVGYIIEVDFEFPVELHDKFLDNLPAPQTIAPDIELFSDFQWELAEHHGIVKNGVYQGAHKLIPHLYTHTNYAIHYRNLKYLAELGVRIAKLHNTISYQQTTWMRPYLEFYNNKRKAATNNFQKDLFKLFNNSIFGKTCANIKNRKELKLTTDHDRAIKRFSKLHFKSSRFIDGLHLITMFKRQVMYDKPSFIGTSMMDVSELHMMRLHSEVIHKNFEGRYNLIYTDTYSLVYAIKHHDIFNWISQHMEHFDLSDNRRPELQDDTNKRYQDVSNSRPIA